jgi:hypothetical protein
VRLSPRRGVLALPILAALVPLTAAFPATSALATGAGSIHPGVSITFGGVTCSAGAILRQGRALFISIPAGCGGITPGKVQDGCVAPESPVGLPVTIGGAKHKGLLVYNSFSYMQLHGVKSPDRCYYDDLALVRINRLDHARVSGAIPGVSAPHSVARSAPISGAGLLLGSHSATAGASHHHGWELDVTPSVSLKSADVGTTAVQNGHLIGLLNALPSGMVATGPAEVYSFSKELQQLHRDPAFRHVTLLRAGERP